MASFHVLPSNKSAKTKWSKSDITWLRMPLASHKLNQRTPSSFFIFLLFSFHTCVTKVLMRYFQSWNMTAFLQTEDFFVVFKKVCLYWKHNCCLNYVFEIIFVVINETLYLYGIRKVTWWRWTARDLPSFKITIIVIIFLCQ